MTSTLEKGGRAGGFIILDTIGLPELDAAGVWARHGATGAEVFHIYNGDSENLFAFAFATPPADNTGAAHVLEHTVLCGSARFPLRDAFLVLAQGSLQTYLNACTYPDKTVYPASSVNERDYFNLMGVYGDAVFNPLLPEWAFMQEGVRREFDGEGRLRINGVVYNEMKGAYSAQDTYAGVWSVRAVMPDTPYAFDSGGDPEDIPRLTWDALQTFHRERYTPANCRVFLAGNIPTERQLAFLEERFFAPAARAGARAGGAVPALAKAERWDKPRSFRVPCPGGGADGQKPSCVVSWLCGDASDQEECAALSVLTDILLGHDGSPLTRALLESGLGEDLSPVCGLETEIRETVFTAGLRGVDGENLSKVEPLILAELRRLAEEGIPAEEIEAALLGAEFANREIRRSGGPWSLVWMRRAMRGWIHGRKPWETLLVVPALEAVKAKALEKGYFEGLITRFLLKNPHRAWVIIEPEEGFLERREAALEEALEKAERDMSEEERKSILTKNEAMKEVQEKGDSPEALASIPHLALGDLSPEPQRIPGETLSAGAVPVLAHPIKTNGITYVDLAFPADLLPWEEERWLPFFSRAVAAVGLPGKDYGEVSSLLARTAGGLHTALESAALAPGAAAAAAAAPGSSAQ